MDEVAHVNAVHFEGHFLIGEGAFLGRTRLSQVALPNTLTGIGAGAFSGCTRLSSVRIPHNATGIGVGAFYGSSSLTSVTIPNSVTNIVYYAFSGCTNLRGAYFLGNAPLFSSDCFSSADQATVYYLPGTSGWGKTFGDRADRALAARSSGE